MSHFDATSTTDEVIEGISLAGKLAVVTGASSGLGVETSRVLAAAGAAVLMLARDEPKLVAAAAGFQHDAEQRTHPTLVPCSIYRLGFVSWHSRTGACNPADWVTRVVRGVAAVHAKPTEREPNNNLSLAPVDYVAGTRTRR